MAKNKADNKALAQSRQKRRQWLTFVRMCRYGINNFSRNAWLTIAATAVMTITLLIIFVTLVARQVLVDTVDQIKQNVSMSIYVKTETTDAQAAAIKTELEKLPSVRSVKYVSPIEARKKVADDNKADIQTLEAINQSKNTLPGTFSISVKDINNTSELRTFVKENKLYKDSAGVKEPSFSGSRQGVIQKIARWVSFAETVGLSASVIFIAISSLIVFNTIRMAIFNRKEEIQMMKLIGADRSFIRGPFVVEAVVYGFVAAIAATVLGVTALFMTKGALISYGVAIQPTIEIVTVYAGFVLVGMITAGALIGVISSLLATQKYLKL